MVSAKQIQFEYDWAIKALNNMQGYVMNYNELLVDVAKLRQKYTSQSQFNQNYGLNVKNTESYLRKIYQRIKQADSHRYSKVNVPPIFRQKSDNLEYVYKNPTQIWSPPVPTARFDLFQRAGNRDCTISMNNLAHFAPVVEDLYETHQDEFPCRVISDPGNASSFSTRFFLLLSNLNITRLRRSLERRKSALEQLPINIFDRMMIIVWLTTDERYYNDLTNARYAYLDFVYEEQAVSSRSYSIIDVDSMISDIIAKLENILFELDEDEEETFFDRYNDLEDGILRISGVEIEILHNAPDIQEYGFWR